MTVSGMPANAEHLAAVVKQGEGPALEFKRSTGELKEGMQTLCAFLNGSGGMVLFGVRPDGTAEGQDATDQTIRDIAQAADRLEPPAHVSLDRVKIKSGRVVVACGVEPALDSRPFTYEGRAYERVGSSTRRMPQAKYEKALLDRAHGKRRWENEPADGVTASDIDRHEVFRILEAARARGHLVEPVGSSLVGVLDRLNGTSRGACRRTSHRASRGPSRPTSTRQVPDKYPTSSGGPRELQGTVAPCGPARGFRTARPRALRK